MTKSIQVPLKAPELVYERATSDSGLLLCGSVSLLVMSHGSEFSGVEKKLIEQIVKSYNVLREKK